MKRRTAADAIDTFVAVVDGDSRFQAEAEDVQQASVFAVFQSECSNDLRMEGFLGLVASRQAAQYPQRIFADLTSPDPVTPISTTTPLDAAQTQLCQNHVEAIPVVQHDGIFAGAVTRESVLASLLSEEKELFQSMRRSLEVCRQQRRLIAYEIHDGLIQYATASKMHLEAFRHRVDHLDKESLRPYHAAVDLLGQAIAEARRLIAGLDPPLIDEAGLVGGLKSIIDQHNRENGPGVELHVRPDTINVDKPIEVAVCRIVQEALTNARRHSGSESVFVSVVLKPGRLLVEIRDWGWGFVYVENHTTGHGLRGIRQRAELLGGNLDVRTSPGTGCCLSISIPVANGN